MSFIKFKDFLKESLYADTPSIVNKSIVIPTRILGYSAREDYIINYIEKGFDIFRPDGEYVRIEMGHPLYAILKEIITTKELVKFKEYKREFMDLHRKYYKENDWDSDYVITDIGEMVIPVQKIKLLF